MIVYPNCKINLGLHVIEKRADKYHNIETIFYPVPLTDTLEIVENADPENSPKFPLTASGFPIEIDTKNNLCVKAYKLLKKDFPKLPWVRVHIHKGIPVGAGLGGGSSDGAFALKLYNDHFKLGISTDKLKEYALMLGSDCPFFINNKPSHATGKGEILQEIDLDLSAYKIVLVNPGIAINTTEAFGKINPSIPEQSLLEIIKAPIERWKDNLTNDFEMNAFKMYPKIVDVKDCLYVQGAIYASMTGSGSTVYGIFEKNKNPQLDFPDSYFVKTLNG